ncbi:MAG: hypothetical protein QOE45_664 [Frankiaceae bacterium]|jgi:hypothetical protein|nr:hypothetical protein [Frankiaceae bacterium]
MRELLRESGSNLKQEDDMNAGTLAVAATLAVGTGVGAVAYQAASHGAPLPATTSVSTVSTTTPGAAAGRAPAAADPCATKRSDPGCTVVVTSPPAARARNAAPAASATPSARHSSAEARHGADDGPNHDINDDHGDDGPNHDINDDHGGDRDDDHRGPGHGDDHGDDDNSGPGNGGHGGDDGSGHDANDDH